MCLQVTLQQLPSTASLAETRTEPTVDATFARSNINISSEAFRPGTVPNELNNRFAKPFTQVIAYQAPVSDDGLRFLK